MHLIRGYAVLLSFLFSAAVAFADGVVAFDAVGDAPSPVPQGILWENLDTGLDLGLYDISRERKATLNVVRIDPARYSFKLYTVQRKQDVMPLRAWAKEHGLVAAINAGMYMPDGFTHTGYLRVGDVVNNGRVAGNLGVFFVSEPDVTDLPEAVLLEKGTTDWKEIIPHYDNVVQNYRMISHDRRVQWTQEGPAHAISAVGQEGDGNILFIHVSEPMTCSEFSRMLLTVPLDIRAVMYVEGGVQAGMLLDAGDDVRVWAGSHTAGLWPTGGMNAPLPNIIGVKRR